MSFSRHRFAGLPLPILFLVAILALAGCSKTYPGKGVVKGIKLHEKTVVIEHEPITNYMDAMTMPFRVKDTNELTGLQAGEVIRFRLHVTENESWISDVVRTGEREKTNQQVRATPSPAPSNQHPLKSFPFTNELGQTVTLNDYKGKALAITFIFTRCPIPDYCPRLTRNFEEAAAKLRANPNAPTNWHLFCVTIDPEFDTPAVLKSYGKRYNYDPSYWSFLTGPKEKIQELASLSGVTYEFVPGSINHSFRTLIINPAGELQMNFPVSGNLSEAIADELMKASKGKPKSGEPTVQGASKGP